MFRNGFANILAMTFLPGSSRSLAILRIDPKENIHLSALDIDLVECETEPSTFLIPTVISGNIHPTDSGHLPHLVPIPALSNPDEMDVDDDDGDNETLPLFRGGILVVGGEKLYLYELSDKASQSRYASKMSKLQTQKQSKDPNVARHALDKEKERNTRKRSAQHTVPWPWGPVTAWSNLPVDPATYVLGDAYGRLVTMSLKQLSTHGLILIPVGQVGISLSAVNVTLIDTKFVPDLSTMHAHLPR